MYCSCLNILFPSRCILFLVAHGLRVCSSILTLLFHLGSLNPPTEERTARTAHPPIVISNNFYDVGKYRLCVVEHIHDRPTYSRFECQLPSPSVGLYPHQQRGNSQAPQFHSLFPFSVDLPVRSLVILAVCPIVLRLSRDLSS
jgi:hypothetical protein